MKTVNKKLNEMPRRVYPVDDELGFKENSNNYKLAKLVIQSKKSILLETTELGNKLYKHGNKFLLVDPFRVRLLYYLKWKEKFYNLINKTVTQEILHWRDRGLFEIRNLTSHIYFDLLLPINNIIMTDYIHTKPGENFWLKLTDDAFDRNMYVYTVNFSYNQLVHIKNKLEFNSLIIYDKENLLNNVWGDEKKFEARRIIISKNNLTNI